LWRGLLGLGGVARAALWELACNPPWRSPGEMQLVGPAHYGFYTFFLTLLALELVSVSQAASWHLALVRVVLTLAGAAVAVASGFLYDRASRSQVHGG
jgi:hypothetical protein